MNKRITKLSIVLVIALFVSAYFAISANAGTTKSIVLEENWRLTSSLDINAGASNILILDGQNLYTIYEMDTAANLTNSTGIVRLKDVRIIHAGATPATGSLAALQHAAESITSVTAPVKDAISITLPAVTGFTVSIESSSNTGVITTSGTVIPPATQQTVNLVLKVNGNGGEAYTTSIAVIVPAKTASSGGGGGGGGGGSSTPTIQAPTNLKATPSAVKIALAWDAVADARGYLAYRKEGTGSYIKISSELIKTASYVDSTALPGVSYTYSITAVDNDSKESDRSNEVTTSLSIVKATITFSDVPSGAWYRDALAKLIEKSILGGYADGTFKPNRAITRAEFAKVICLAKGWQLVTPTTPSFTDVSITDWSYQYIETAKQNKAIGGYPNGYFYKDKPITRAEIAKILAAAFSLPAGSSTLIDVNTHWAKNQINCCVQAGLINGYPGSVFRPDVTATRAEAAKMIAGAI